MPNSIDRKKGRGRKTGWRQMQPWCYLVLRLNSLTSNSAKRIFFFFLIAFLLLLLLKARKQIYKSHTQAHNRKTALHQLNCISSYKRSMRENTENLSFVLLWVIFLKFSQFFLWSFTLKYLMRIIFLRFGFE